MTYIVTRFVTPNFTITLLLCLGVQKLQFGIEITIWPNYRHSTSVQLRKYDTVTSFKVNFNKSLYQHWVKVYNIRTIILTFENILTVRIAFWYFFCVYFQTVLNMCPNFDDTALV